MNKREEKEFTAICQDAHARVSAVLRCLDVLVPDAPLRLRKRFANRILQMCDGRNRDIKINEAVLREMVLRNHQCIARFCPMLLFTEPMTRELNAYFNEWEEQ